LEPQQVQLACLLQELARELPVVFVQTIHDWKHFLLHEFGSRLSEEALLFRQIFAHEHVVRPHHRCEELSAGDGLRLCFHWSTRKMEREASAERPTPNARLKPRAPSFDTVRGWEV